QAVEVARRVGDSYHEAESLIGLAESLEHIGQSSIQVLKEAKRISYRYSYHYLLGRAEEIQGDVEYKLQKYRAAFKHYRVACRSMALYSHLEFERFLRKIDDLLIDTPTDFLPGIIDTLLE